MNRYQELRETVSYVSQRVIGKTWQDAEKLCHECGLKCRCIQKDGHYTMITADVKMDRIGFIINDGIVTGVQNG